MAPPTGTRRRLFSTGAAAKVAGCHPVTILRAIERGELAASRHYFGWYALQVLELPAHVIALHFRHQDGGELVRKNYGHPNAAMLGSAVCRDDLLSSAWSTGG